jgi:hypothetical protein
MSAPEELLAWNQAHERVTHYLETFALGDHAQLSRLALRFLDEARELHRADPTIDPATVTMRHAQTTMTHWLAINLGDQDQSASQVLANGYIALLLSRLAQNSPEAFLTSPLPEDLRHSLRQTLVITGPDLTVSSMTPRHFDFGPMLDIARETWHRWDAKAFLTAVLFWLGVYVICYWCLAQYL